MAKKKKSTPKQEVHNIDYKKIILALLFVFVSLIWFINFDDIEKPVLQSVFQPVLEKIFWWMFFLIFSPVMFALGIFLMFRKDIAMNSNRIIWLLLYFVSFTSLIGFVKRDYAAYLDISSYLKELTWPVPTFWFMFLVLAFSLFLIFKISYKKIFIKIKDNIKSNIKKWFEESDFYDDEPVKPKKKSQVDQAQDKKISAMSKEMKEVKEQKIQLEEKIKESNKQKQLTIDDSPKKIPILKQKPQEKDLKKVGNENIRSLQKVKNSDFSWWELPDIDLLVDYWTDIKYDENVVAKKELDIKEKLLQFKIEVDMMWYRVWPTVIQFRLKPKEWIKLTQIVNLKKDLTLALHAKSIRIQAPIPGQWAVWIEVPNEQRAIVWLKEILESSEFNNPKNLIPISVWKNVNGEIIVWDLTKMPHLLIAGQTWSWKSVWMNWFLLSMLYKFSPSELKFVMIDPKMVELSIYNWIPHLLTPVITNPDKAVNALKWAVAEMLKRYSLATAVWAKNLWEYNKKVSKEEAWPFIVIVIDELADLMMSGNKKEVEGSIARIAQMARAVWMHLIVATQRPSVDVITWTIKANIPSRIAFTVSSVIDSRTVIDKWGAEDLLWRWDMLYSPTWVLEPERVQWVLVETSEIENVVNQIRLTIDPDMLNNLYDDSIVNWKSNLEWSIMEKYNWDQDEEPELVEKAIAIVREAKKWSTSLVQRKLWLWYARAAKILDILEELWVVWPANWSKPRDVYE